MAATRQLFVLAWRESRTARRRLLLYMSSISLGVAALVAIDSFSENVIRSVHEQSRALLGGDLAARRNSPRPAAVDSLIDSLSHAGVASATSTGFTSMALVPRSGGTRLVQVHAVSAGYPFFGNIITDPPAAWGQLQSGASTIVDPALLVSLDAQIGDTLSLGTAKFVITGSLKSVPGDVGISAAIGPRVYIPERFVPATGLVVFGSRADYETLFKLPITLTTDQFASRFGKRLTVGGGSVQSAGYNESRLASAIDQLHDFLAIVGLIALLLGGIGVASGVHAFVMRKIDPVAILRCVGATSWQVLAIYAMQAAVMGFVGAAAGVLLGLVIQFAMPQVLHDFLPVDVDLHLAPRPIALGLGIGVWVALLFALRPLVALRRVSPLQALRREPDADALRRARWDPLRIGLTLAIAATVLALGLSRSNTPRRGIGFTLAIAGAIGILWLSAAGLSWAARRLIRPSWPFPLRQGVASLYRPGNQTRSVVLALGFGVFLMGTLYQVQHNILRSLNLRMGEARSNVVFFDVQENQQPGIDSIIRAAHEELIDQTPIIAMRIASINGKSATEIADQIDKERRARDSARVAATRAGGGGGRGVNMRDRRGPWAFRREFRSTFRDTLTASERLVSGKWFGASGVGSVGEVSLDSSVAAELGVKLRDSITWNVQGVLIPTIVTSTRSVQWQTFAPNFFVVFNPQSLAAAPKQFAILVHASTPAAIAHLQRDVVSKYPSVSSLDLTLVQQTVTSVLGKVTMAVRFLALISLGLAVPVLFSAVAATRRDRLREGVLLKVLGATRRQIVRIMLAEYALLGTLGALTGVLLSTLAAWGLMRVIFKMSFSPALASSAVVAAAMIGLAVSIGLLTGRDVFAETPMAALRET